MEKYLNAKESKIVCTKINIIYAFGILLVLAVTILFYTYETEIELFYALVFTAGVMVVWIAIFGIILLIWASLKYKGYKVEKPLTVWVWQGSLF